MTASAEARSGYESSWKSTGTPRAVEYQAFARMTAALAAAELSRQDDRPRYIRALSDNLRLWTTLGLAVAGEANGLPKDLRARLFYLFEFTRAHTRRLMSDEPGAGAAPLIDVNRAVMQGLRGAAAAADLDAPGSDAAQNNAHGAGAP